MRLFIAGVFAGCALLLAAQAARAWHVHQIGSDPLLGEFWDCIEWADRLGWSTDKWSFTRTYWTCVQPL